MLVLPENIKFLYFLFHKVVNRLLLKQQNCDLHYSALNIYYLKRRSTIKEGKHELETNFSLSKNARLDTRNAIL